MPRHKGKQFLTNPAKEPSGGNVGFFHPLKYPAGVAKYDDKTGESLSFAVLFRAVAVRWPAPFDRAVLAYRVLKG